MAKALVNKGVPIKADNPKDPYIRDASGINEIVNANTTFGKTLGTSDSKIQLKNGDTVLSEQDIFSLYESTDPTIDPGYYQIDTSTYPYPTISLWGRNLLVGEFYKVAVINEDFSAFGIVQAVEADDSSITFSINCSGIEDVINAGAYFYIQVDSINGSEYVCTGYKELPGERTYYERPIKVGDYLDIENDTLKVALPEPKYLTKNEVLTVKDVSGVYKYQLDTVAKVYHGGSSGINADITWDEDANQDDIVQEAINYMIGREGQKPVAISINPTNSGSSVGDVYKHITMYPVYKYNDSNLDKIVVVFSSTVYDGTNVYLYSVKMYVGGPAAQIERVKIV